MTAANTPNIISDPYLEARTFWPALVAGVAFIWACLHYGVDWYWCAGGIFAFFLAAACLSKQATIDYSQRTVRECMSLFGRRVIQTSEFPFSAVDAIVYRQYSGEDQEVTSVGLRLRSGRRIRIRNFSTGGSQRSRAAEEFAWRISCDSDIRIDEDSR
jgi:hypothetical protein